jgi:hypothetical protein
MESIKVLKGSIHPLNGVNIDCYDFDWQLLMMVTKASTDFDCKAISVWWWLWITRSLAAPASHLWIGLPPWVLIVFKNHNKSTSWVGQALLSIFVLFLLWHFIQHLMFARVSPNWFYNRIIYITSHVCLCECQLFSINWIKFPPPFSINIFCLLACVPLWYWMQFTPHVIIWSPCKEQTMWVLIYFTTSHVCPCGS